MNIYRDPIGNICKLSSDQTGEHLRPRQLRHLVLCAHILKYTKVQTEPKRTGASSFLRAVINPEHLQMREARLAEATCHLGVLGISNDDVKHSKALRS